MTKPYLENQIIPANKQENRGFQCPKHGASNRIQDSWIAQWRSRWSTTNDGWRYMQLFLWLRRHERFIVSGRLAIESSGPRPSLTPRSFFPIFSYRRWQREITDTPATCRLWLSPAVLPSLHRCVESSPFVCTELAKAFDVDQTDLTQRLLRKERYREGRFCGW